MGMKRIMLACAAGMSTSMLVAKMQKAAQEKGLDTEIFAVPASEAQSKGVPVGVIPMMDYGMMNGAKVLDFAENLVRGQ